MPTYILNALRYYLVLLSQTALLLSAQPSTASASQASTVYLAPGLEVPLPSALALEIIKPQDQITGPILAGEVNNNLSYFIAASKAESWGKNIVLWKMLETGIRKQSSTGNFILRARGNFSTNAGDMAWFRAYEYTAGEQIHRQVYFILKNQHTVYWITLTMTETVNIDLTIPIAKALIQRARIITD